MHFIDTDIVLQQHAGRLLQEMIDQEGPEAFLKTEERTILSLEGANTVIATGGSVVFSGRAMERLGSVGVVIYLDISFDEMVLRLDNIMTRGIVLHAGENLHEMYNERAPLYEKYADLTIDCSDAHVEQIVKKIVDELPRFR